MVALGKGKLYTSLSTHFILPVDTLVIAQVKCHRNLLIHICQRQLTIFGDKLEIVENSVISKRRDWR